MQYSSDKINWMTLPGKFDSDKIARFLRIKPGEYIYFRDGENSLIQELKWGKKYGK